MNWQVKQQINFYTEAFQPPQLPRDIAYVLLGLSLNIVLMLTLAFASWIYVKWEEKQLAAIQQQELFLQQQIEQVMASRPTLEVDSALEQRKLQAEENLSSSRKILSYLTQGHLQQSHSYSSKVAQLGEQKIDGVWLQRFLIADQGQQVILEGFLDDPAKLSPYISTLVQRPAYQDIAFRFVDIQKPEEQRWLSFVLDTHSRDGNDDNPESTASDNTTQTLAQGANQ